MVGFSNIEIKVVGFSKKPYYLILALYAPSRSDGSFDVKCHRSLFSPVEIRAETIVSRKALVK